MKNVLIIDDNAIVRTHLRGLLERDACVVGEAADGVEGLEQARTLAWDAIFLDLQMPRLDGAGVLRELERLQLKTPVILITSSESSAEIVQAYKHGAREYLLKPFREDQVRRAMRLVAGLDPTTLSRSGCHVAVLDPDEGVAMTVRNLLGASDQVHLADSVQAVPEIVGRPHQVVLVGAWETSPTAREEEAEAIGDLVTQKDPDAALVRLLDPGAELPELTVFHASVARTDEAELQRLVQSIRSGGVIASARTIRALRFQGPEKYRHLYWWSLLRNVRHTLERSFAAKGSAVIDLSLAPDEPQARASLEQTLRAEAEARMFQLRFVSGVERLTLIGPPGLDATTVRPPTQAAASPPAAPATQLEVSPGALTIPGYDLGECLGEGGMSRVFRATQRSLKRQVCVKLMRDELATEPGLAERFQDEGIALATLRHPNIVSVLDVGRADSGQLFMLMEYVAGGDLRALLKDQGHVAVAPALELTCQLLSGLAEAHAAGIVHRDIKPSNILVSTLKDGSRLVKLVDFGIAKLVEGTRLAGATRVGQIIGTPGYMAPEQFLGMEVTPATDLHAVGIVLFELLTGRRPFVARDAFELAQLTMLTPAPRVAELVTDAVPPGLDALISALLAKNPRDRPQSATEVRARILALPPVALKPTG